ncbi:uncharacterized protein TNCV_1910131 [Trichonephila clavipes]|nr:uncharacterized protein TNCV_1910131 [Trichonephila clavipes]
MFVVLSVCIMIEKEHWSAPLKWESVPEMSLSPISIVGMILCASRIPAQVENCNMSLQLLRDRLIRESETNWKNLLLVKAMMDKKFPHMSACSFAKFTPQLIVSIFGTFFTYGLLIVNMSVD